MASQGGGDHINVEAVVKGRSRKREKVNVGGNCSYWSDLPCVLLEIILSHLGFIDFFMFARVCKSWRAAALGVRQQVMANQGPLALLKARNARKNVFFYNLFDQSLYRTSLPHLSGNKCVGFTCGYLVLAKNRGTVWLVNPVTRHEIEFPCPRKCYTRFVLASLLNSSSSSQPQPQRYVALAYAKFEPCLQFCMHGDGEWTVYECEKPNFTVVDVAVFDGKIYVLTSDGRLWTLRVNSTRSSSSRVPTVRMQQLHVKNVSVPGDDDHVNLVAYGQHLYFTIYRHIEIRIHRLNLVKMAWERVTSMSREIVLFISDKKSSAFTYPKPDPPLDQLEAIVGRPLNRVCYLGEEGRCRFGGHNARYLAGMINKAIPAKRRDGTLKTYLTSPHWYFPHLSCMVDPVYEED